MTCIVGVIDNGTIVMGADSLVSNGWHQRHTVNSSMPKIVKKGEMLIGFCGYLRAGNILHHEFDPPKHLDPSVSDLQFIAKEIVNKLRQTFKDAGINHKEDGSDGTGGSLFLIGYRGHLYEIGVDWSTLETDTPYVCVGSGEPYAYGSLYTSTGTPKERVKKALETAAHFVISVGGPFHYETLKGDKTDDGQK